MTLYTWAVWKDCRLVGYVKGYSEYSAVQKAEKEYGQRIFLERTWVGQPMMDNNDLSCHS